MKAGELFKILQDNFSTGTLSPDDDIMVYDKNSNTFKIVEAECDSMSSDFSITIEDY